MVKSMVQEGNIWHTFFIHAILFSGLMVSMHRNWMETDRIAIPCCDAVEFRNIVHMFMGHPLSKFSIQTTSIFKIGSMISQRLKERSFPLISCSTLENSWQFTYNFVFLFWISWTTFIGFGFHMFLISFLNSLHCNLISLI